MANRSCNSALSDLDPDTGYDMYDPRDERCECGCYRDEHDEQGCRTCDCEDSR